MEGTDVSELLKIVLQLRVLLPDLCNRLLRCLVHLCSIHILRVALFADRECNERNVAQEMNREEGGRE